MKNLTVVAWGRSQFYNSLPTNFHMYYFLKDDQTVMWDCVGDLPLGFLRISDTALYEFGGTHEEAVKALEKAGYTNILITNNLT